MCWMWTPDPTVPFDQAHPESRLCQPFQRTTEASPGMDTNPMDLPPPPKAASTTRRTGRRPRPGASRPTLGCPPRAPPCVGAAPLDTNTDDGASGHHAQGCRTPPAQRRCAHGPQNNSQAARYRSVTSSRAGPARIRNSSKRRSGSSRNVSFNFVFLVRVLTKRGSNSKIRNATSG